MKTVLNYFQAIEVKVKSYIRFKLQKIVSFCKIFTSTTYKKNYN